MTEVTEVLTVRSARQNKEMEYRQHSHVVLQLLFQAQITEGSVSLEEVLKYPLSPVSPSLLFAPWRGEIRIIHDRHEKCSAV